MDHYETGKMRGCAQDILAELKNYSAAKSNVDNTVDTLRNNWQDETNTGYAQKYNSEAKVAAENVETLMKQFSEVLAAAADGFEKIHNIARQDMGV